MFNVSNKDKLLVFSGNFLYALSQWLLVVVIIKIGNQYMLGQYSYALSLISPIVLFANFQLRNLVATDIGKNLSLKNYFYFRLFFQLLVILVIFTISITINVSFELKLIIFLLSLAKLVESLTDILFGNFQREKKIGLIGISDILKSVFTIIVFTLIMYFSKNLILAILGLCVVWILRFVFFDLNKSKIYFEIKKTRADMTIYKNLLLLSYPLGILSLISSLNTNIPRYIIEWYWGLEQLGYFTSISYFVVLSTLITSPVLAIYIPKLSYHFKLKNFNDFNNIVKRISLIFFSIGMIGLFVGLLLGEFILEILYNPATKQYYFLLILIIFAIIISMQVSLINALLVVLKSFKQQMINNLLVLIISLPLSFYFIKKFGLNGAGIYMISVFLLQLIINLYHYYISYQRIKKS